jgi:hypothetical protein
MIDENERKIRHGKAGKNTGIQVVDAANTKINNMTTRPIPAHR